MADIDTIIRLVTLQWIHGPRTACMRKSATAAAACRWNGSSPMRNFAAFKTKVSCPFPGCSRCDGGVYERRADLSSRLNCRASVVLGLFMGSGSALRAAMAYDLRLSKALAKAGR